MGGIFVSQLKDALLLRGLTYLIEKKQWLMGSAMVSESTSLGHCVVFLGKTLNSQWLSPPWCIHG